MTDTAAITSDVSVIPDAALLTMLQQHRTERRAEKDENYLGFTTIASIDHVLRAGWPDVRPTEWVYDDQARARCEQLAERFDSLHQRRLVCVYPSDRERAGDCVCITETGERYIASAHSEGAQL